MEGVHMLFLVVIFVSVACDQTIATLLASQTSEFCVLHQRQLHCDFSNTTEAVVIREVGLEVEEVRVEAATGLQGFPPCDAHLHVWFSSNVTLQGPVTHLPANTESSTQSTRSQHRIYFPTDNRSAQNVSVSSSSAVQTSSGSDANVSSSASDTSDSDVEGETKCVGNVSVVQSEIQWLRGQFDLTSLNHTEVATLEGTFDTLDISGKTEVVNISVSAKLVTIEDTNINTLSHLAVEQQLQLKNVKIRYLVPPGILLYGAQTSGGQISYGIRLQGTQSTDDEATRHTLNTVNVNELGTKALHLMSGRAVVTNLRINKASSDAITVEDGGTLELSNVYIRRGPLTSLTLHGEARVILDNFTLDSNTISHLEVSSKSSQKTMYPLFTVWPAEEATSDNNWVSLPWYWIVIMAGVGIVAGVVVGTAVMWRRPGQLAVLSLADLLSREKQEEENENQAYASPDHPPQVTRQDSGQTSSSFSSFTQC